MSKILWMQKTVFFSAMLSENLIYGKVIGDGDSSVYKRILEAAPYGPTFVIDKIECRNHLLRNYLNKLSELAKDTRFPVILRKTVTNSNTLGRFRNAVTKAIEYRKQGDAPFHVKVDLLKKDIINGPKHIFGEHSACDEYFCTKDNREEDNIVGDLTTSGLFDVVVTINKRLANNAWSLLHDVDTNSAETYNSIVAKFIGGKRINFSLRNSYLVRCYGAAISYNENGNFICKIEIALSGKSPGRYTKMFYQRRRKAMEINNAKKPLKRKLFASTDEHYGPEASTSIETLEDMSAVEYEAKSTQFLQELNIINRVHIFENTVMQSNSNLWRVERRKRVTASNFGKICKLRKSTSTAKTVASLLYSTFRGNSATDFGLHSEDIAISLFEKQYGKTVKRSGLIIDEDAHYLACSPDGLIDQDCIIEIKSSEKSGSLCPIEAAEQHKIDFCEFKDAKLILKRNHNYYYQVQGILHISKRNLCYFIIYTKGGIHVEEIARDDKFWTEHMEKKLCEFYMKSLLPELVDSRRSRKKNIRCAYMP